MSRQSEELSRVDHIDILGESLLDRANGMCKGPEVSAAWYI